MTTVAPQLISIDVFQEKYAKGNETTHQEVYARVAKAVAAQESTKAKRQLWEKEFLSNFERGAVGAGRIMSSAGSGIQATLINCFVQPVGDAITGKDDDGLPGIYEALQQAAETMRRGGGVGYDFSFIRPVDAFVKGTASMASGPCSYMDVFDMSCKTVESAGGRRGAQMGVLRIDHPDIAQFITAKRTPGRWNNFNVSVGVTDSFMEAVKADAPIDLYHKAKPAQKLIDDGAVFQRADGEWVKGAFQREDGMWVYRTVKAKDLWDSIMQSAYDFAEPGILFRDRMNKDNNLNYCEVIYATNPCGEQPLPAYGCCDLGPLILPKFIRNPFGFAGTASFDFAEFEKAVAIQVRFLDNVLEATHWPLEQQRAESASKRRIGVGFTGLGNALTMLKLGYNTPEGLAFAEKIATVMRDTAYEASVELAEEKGAFPLFDAEKYLATGTFASRLPESIKAKIRKHGIRNSHLLSIAPVGTISLAFADNASNGIEPPFTWTYNRNKVVPGGKKVTYAVEDHAYRVYRELGGDVTNLPDYFVSALSMSAAEHIAMMEVVQPYIDTSISKTVNVPVDMPFENFKGMYLQAHGAGLKGLSTYRPNATLGAVLEVTPAPKAEEPSPAVAAAVAAAVDPMRAAIERRPEGQLPSVVEKVVYWNHEGKQTLYLTVSFLPLDDGRERAIEFFMPVGQQGESQQWISSTMRMLSLAARGGFLEHALRDMRKVAWDRGPVRLGEMVREDGVKVPMWHDSEVAAIAYAIEQIIANHDKAVAERKQSEGLKDLLAQAIEACQAAKDGLQQAAKGGEDSALHKLLDLLGGVTKAAAVEAVAPAQVQPVAGNTPMPGKKCHECGAHAVIKVDGCEKCTSCGMMGSCG